MTMIRLDKFLTEMKLGSRSQVKELIRKGRVAVDDIVCKEPERKLQTDTQCVTVDGEAVSYAEYEYYMLNKPQGVVSATEDNLHKTVIELIGDAKRKDLFPVGRLDIDTEGLLLITNDGQLAHELLAPKKHVDKVYFARVEGCLPEDAVNIFSKGFELSDGTPVLSSKLLIESICEDTTVINEVRLTIHEGKFHQVKRMFEVFGCQVIYLKRLSMGSLLLDDSLEPGAYRALSKEEEAGLKKGSRHTC